MVAPMLRIPVAVGQARLAADAAAAAAAPLAALVPEAAPVAAASFRSPFLSSLPLGHSTQSFARSSYDSAIGVSVSAGDPDAPGGSQSGEATKAEILRDALTFQLHFRGSEGFEHCIAVLALLVGVALVVAGVRLFRPLLFCASWMLLGGLVFFISMLLSDYDSLTSFLCGLLIGLVLALAVLRVWKVSLAIVGALAGLVCGILMASMLGPSAFVSEVGRGVFLALCAVVGGALAVQGEKRALLVCTPLLGSFLLLQGLDHFLRLKMNAWTLLSSEGQSSCAASGGALRCAGIYFLVCAITVAGVFVQWRWTAGLSSPAAAPVKASKAVPEMVVLSSPQSGADKKKGGGSSSNGNPFASPSSHRARGASPTETSSSSSGGNPFSKQRRSAYGYNTPKTPEFFEG